MNRIEQEFQNTGYLDEALTHKSAKTPTHNSRLAVLGKNIARALASEQLVFRFPHLPGVCCEVCKILDA